MAVSIVIPSKNAGDGFRETLESIRGQRGFSAELIVVDSGSSDGTVALAREHGARTISISPASFNHGETRNLGIREAQGEVCVLLAQDAVPADDQWLEQLLAPFRDERVAGVTGRQIARPQADPMGRWEVEWGDRFLGRQILVREVRDWNTFWNGNYDERLRTAWFSNVCSAVRRAFWSQHPFRALSFAEDLDWAMQALVSGRRIVYSPPAAVVHSHSRSAASRLKRHYVANKVTRKLLRAVPMEPVARSDAEFFSAVTLLCAEVQEITPGALGRIAGWRDGWRGVLAASAVPRVQWQLTSLRQHFRGLCEQILKLEPPPEPAANGRLARQALAYTIGVFTASYYNWCEARDRLSAEMRRLDEALCEGV
jgi:GT2 family glycosyltransferase